ncbi:MAG: metallophosphoesterase [Nitrospirae bacterium]|nr:metallophosphoesterase [Nitrospirota bacterium]
MKNLIHLLKIPLLWILAVPFLIQCGGSSTQPPRAKYIKPLYKWVELGPGGAVIARAVTKGNVCPDITIDSTPVSMNTRIAKEKDNWDITVCEFNIPPEAKSVLIDSTPLPLINKKSLSRVLVIGDTGCRITDEEVQACNREDAWPFPSIANAAAQYKPDLIIHIGDYVYRDSLCPYDFDGCRASPYGDNWDSWEADFLSPAKALLPAAPWIFLRGDRENCVLNHQGWFRLLDPFPYSQKCENFSEPYNVDLDGLTLSVIDSTSANDITYVRAKSSRYATYLKTYENTTAGHRWFLTHRPIWAVAEDPGIEENPNDRLFTLNHTLQTAFASAEWDALLAKYEMAISGHLHVFDVFTFNEQGTPPQVIAGNSGTLLYPGITAKVPGYKIGHKTLKSVKNVSAFGFTTIEPANDGWGVTLRDKNGKPITSCTVEKGSASCR